MEANIIENQTLAQRIESIQLHFDEKVQKYFINNKEGGSSDDVGSSSLYVFTIRI